MAAQEGDLLVQCIDLLLLVIDATVQLADQIVCPEDRFLALLTELLAEVDDLLGQNALHICRPLQSVEARLVQQLLYEIIGLHGSYRLRSA